MATKATVYLTIFTEVEIPHSDYLGETASVEEHIKKAKNTVKGWKVLIQKPGQEVGEVVNARVVLNHVEIREV